MAWCNDKGHSSWRGLKWWLCRPYAFLMGKLYLELLLAKSRSPVDVAGGGGWCHGRQGAELQSFLELMALERAAANGWTSAEMQAVDCVKHAVPEEYVKSRTLSRSEILESGVTSVGCLYSRYLGCWREASDHLAGPVGQRSTWRARPIDPAVGDLAAAYG